MSKKAEKSYFSPDLSDRERASFEIGIKLGAIYHIMSGIPVSSEEKTIASIEKGIEAAIACQPYVKSVKVNLDRKKIKGEKKTPFDYDEVSGRIIHAEVVLEYEKVIVSGKIDWVENLQYPLMFIEKISEKN